jgi:hypothetical protein
MVSLPIVSPHGQQTRKENLIKIIRAIKEIPPQCLTLPEFSFNLTSEAAKKNYLTLMRKYKGNLAALLEAQHNLTVGYSSDFWDVVTLARIFGQHPNWLQMSQILTNGLEWPLEPLHKKRRCWDVDEALAFGNGGITSARPPQETCHKGH